MMEIILAFRSRTHAIKLNEALSKEGYYTTLTATPTGIGNGCSMSVRTERTALLRAQEVIEAQSLTTFIGAYEVSGTFTLRKLL